MAGRAETDGIPHRKLTRMARNWKLLFIVAQNQRMGVGELVLILIFFFFIVFSSASTSRLQRSTSNVQIKIAVRTVVYKTIPASVTGPAGSETKMFPREEGESMQGVKGVVMEFGGQFST